MKRPCVRMWASESVRAGRVGAKHGLGWWECRRATVGACAEKKEREERERVIRAVMTDCPDVEETGADANLDLWFRTVNTVIEAGRRRKIRRKGR